MKLEIIQPGWGGYTGMLCGVEFENGVTVDEVSMGKAQQISANIEVRSSTGVETNPCAVYDSMKNNAADVVAKSTDVPDLTPEQANDLLISQMFPDSAEDHAPVTEAAFEPLTDIPTFVAYTEESLGKIVDEGGISALRNIAIQFDVKSKSVSTLIAGILQAQSKA